MRHRYTGCSLGVGGRKTHWKAFRESSCEELCRLEKFRFSACQTQTLGPLGSSRHEAGPLTGKRRRMRGVRSPSFWRKQKPVVVMKRKTLQKGETEGGTRSPALCGRGLHPSQQLHKSRERPTAGPRKSRLVDESAESHKAGR